MISTLLCVFVALVAFVASEVTTAPQTSEGSLLLNLQHRLSSRSEFVDRTVVTAIPLSPRWKTQTQFSGKILQEQIPLLSESVANNDYYSIRVLSNPNDESSDYVQASIRMVCRFFFRASFF